MVGKPSGSIWAYRAQWGTAGVIGVTLATEPHGITLQGMCQLEMPWQAAQGLTPSRPISFPPPPERGEHRLRPAQPLLPPVRRNAPILPPAPGRPQEEQQQHGDGGAGGLLQPPEQESTRGQWLGSGGHHGGRVTWGGVGTGKQLAVEVTLGRRWTPASADGWDMQVSSAKGESGVWGELGCQTPTLLCHGT